jgi:hypothetical protein
MKIDENFYDDLVGNRDELFRQADERIKGRELTPDELWHRELKKQRLLHTEEVAKAILKLVSGIMHNANKEYGSIDNLDHDLGTLGTSNIDAKNTGYYFNDEGLTIDLNYTRAEMWGNLFTVRNFVDDVDFEYLQEILSEYGIEISRDEHQINAGDERYPEYITIDSTTIKLKSNTKTK